MLKHYEYIDRDGDVLNIYPSAGQERSVCLWVGGSGVFVPADKIEEICDKLREVAGLPPVWTVEKKTGSAHPMIDGFNRVKVSFPENWLMSDDVRVYASVLLDAADKAEARADRPKLPTTEDSVIKIDGIGVWVRGPEQWRSSTSGSFMTDRGLAGATFKVLHDAGKETT